MLLQIFSLVKEFKINQQDHRSFYYVLSDIQYSLPYGYMSLRQTQTWNISLGRKDFPHLMCSCLLCYYPVKALHSLSLVSLYACRAKLICVFWFGSWRELEDNDWMLCRSCKWHATAFLANSISITSVSVVRMLETFRSYKFCCVEQFGNLQFVHSPLSLIIIISPVFSF